MLPSNHNSNPSHPSVSSCPSSDHANLHLQDTPPHVAAFAQYINTPARLARASATTNTTAATSVPALAASSAPAPASTPAPAQASYASASTAASAPGPALYAFERIHYGPASNPTWLAPTSSNALAPSPNQLAGQKRSRQDFEPQREVRRPVSPRDIPAYRVTSRKFSYPLTAHRLPHHIANLRQANTRESHIYLLTSPPSATSRESAALSAT